MTGIPCGRGENGVFRYGLLEATGETPLDKTEHRNFQFQANMESVKFYNSILLC
jgi:hypothetical protein